MSPELLGVLGKISGGIWLGLNGFRDPRVQAILPPGLRWEAWPLGVKLGVVIGGSFVAATLAKVSEGTAILGALVAAASIAINEVTRHLGYAQTAAAVGKDPSYKPSALREALSIALPINRELLKTTAQALRR